MDVKYCNNISVDINQVEARLVFSIDTPNKEENTVETEKVADIRMSPELFISFIKNIAPQLLKDNKNVAEDVIDDIRR